ncbi:MAG: hypothetical protein KY391_01880 [Actinobacteria bacterium]|nr:hypothetical protein [Actinomycetota bacterium]
MGIRRALSDLRELHHSVIELFDDDRSAEAEASLQIAKSAQRFSKNTKEVVDDKLSFSATLMRAGEVQAANRLLAEVEHEVREEEAALIETVNEVKVAQSMRRERITRLRLARMLAVATMGSVLLTFSAAGMAVAGFFRDRAEAISRPHHDSGANVAMRDSKKTTGRADRKTMRRLRIGDVNVILTQQQFQKLKELAGGDMDSEDLEDLLHALPDVLASKIQQAITVAQAEAAKVETEVGTIIAAPEKSLQRKKRAAKKAAGEAQQEEAAPEEESSPEPSPSGEDDEQKDGEDGDSNETSEEEGDGGPPLPIEP